MASKRPAARQKTGITAPAMYASRPRPLIRAPIPSEPSPRDNPSSTQSSSLNTQSQKISESSESSIQVVIRCRRRSDREIQENSPIIVSSNGARSKEISVETGAPQSSLGIVTLPPLRTYPFDLVFGPEADQAMVYHNVVSPMLEEVLMGYNCTLFAYGQTGTGKTYTMHGDLKPTPMGNPSPDAGMIPRVLFRLFHSLETSKADYSVKISYIELYNEELRDLLASDFSPPTSSTQPMGISGKEKAAELKIFDDAGKKGVFIQGLEETAVKDCKDALALLNKGSERRQIAATRFNDHSSRSHSIFSITVHVKETSNIGDDLLKVGKMNLVDLAGSENIGRSGAENKRAREAGMINQSLLTLGRVINALVDNAAHVPYRESKLTRLLQDSLGGRTKTCIVATISPARSNMEETLSTLDYALRAKSIRNKPEVNQRMTRNGLLKEYIAEIERLKHDLLAAREKNGIFFSEESWNELNAEQELRQTELQEAKRQIEIVEGQLRAVREEFEQSIGLLMKRDEELKVTKSKLERTTAALNHTEGQLSETRAALDDEVVVCQAHKNTEVRLNSVAEGLKNIAAESLRDISGLFRKLERKSGVFDSNSSAVAECGETLSSLTNRLSKKLDELSRCTVEVTTQLQAAAKEVGETEIEKLSTQSQIIVEQLSHIQITLQTIQHHNTTESEALEVIRDALAGMQTTFKSEFVSWGANLMSYSSSICDELEMTSQNGTVAVEKALNDVHSVLEFVLQEIQGYIKDGLTSLELTRQLTNEAAQTEIVRLREQNEALIRMLKSEKVKADRAKGVLLHNMSEMLDGFMNEHHSRLEVNMNDLRDQNLEAQNVLELYLEQHNRVVGQMTDAGTSTQTNLHGQGASAKRNRDGTFKTLEQTKLTHRKAAQKLRDQLSTSISSHTAWVTDRTSAYAASTSEAFDHHSRAKRIRLDTTETLGKETESNYGRLQSALASSSNNLGIAFNTIRTETASFSEASLNHHNSLNRDIESVHATTKKLVEYGTQPDVPTGKTPQKKTWKYVDHWDLTKNREALLRKRANEGSIPKQSATHLAGVGLDEDEGHDFSELAQESMPLQDSTPVLQITSRSPTSSTSSMVTPHDSPDSQIPHIVPNRRQSIVESLRPLPQKKTFVSKRTSLPPPPPLADSRRKNVVTSRLSRRSVR